MQGGVGEKGRAWRSAHKHNPSPRNKNNNTSSHSLTPTTARPTTPYPIRAAEASCYRPKRPTHPASTCTQARTWPSAGGAWAPMLSWALLKNSVSGTAGASPGSWDVP